MPRSLGLLARSLFGLNGLLTVWCLGCCGFEPLVYAGSRTEAMECAAAMQSAGESENPDASVIAADVTTDAPDCACACQSCCAVSAARFVFHAGASESPDLPLTFSDSLIGSAPQPLYPPPKDLSLRA